MAHSEEVNTVKPASKDNKKSLNYHIIRAGFFVASGAVKGVMGKGVSFINTPNEVDSTETFASLGAVAGLLSVLPHALTTSLINKSAFLTERPQLKKNLVDANHLLIEIAALTLAARRLGLPPLGVTTVSIMVIPTIAYVYEICSSQLKDAADKTLSDDNDLSSSTNTSMSRYPTVEDDDIALVFP